MSTPPRRPLPNADNGFHAYPVGDAMIIAVGSVEAKFAKAKELGATHPVNAKTDDAVKAIRAMTGGGVDYSSEAIGLKSAAEQRPAWRRIRSLS